MLSWQITSAAAKEHAADLRRQAETRRAGTESRGAASSRGGRRAERRERTGRRSADSGAGRPALATAPADVYPDDVPRRVRAGRHRSESGRHS